MEIHERITLTIQARARRRIAPIITFLEANDILQVRIAGNSLNKGEPNDIDLFPADGKTFVRDGTSWKGATLISTTKNADTLLVEGCDITVQLCNYEWPTLEELVKSFDYAHIQVGAYFDDLNEWEPEVYFPAGYITAQATGTTWFTGSEYPMSSLIRAGKYYKQDAMSRGAYMACVLEALLATAKRGFESYEDFLDQLDAVDLGLVPEEWETWDRGTLEELYSLLCKEG